ncbi:MAG TPA: hypothetical protein VGZ22_29510 [Isosphaeraceae bacterium]|nr:hypothetical protein [Isosphaeraceae bacterium]
MDVSHWHREEEPPGPGGQPAAECGKDRQRPAADDVVAVVNRAQERVKVGCGPGLGSRCRERDRMGRDRRGQRLLESLAEAELGHVGDRA